MLHKWLTLVSCPWVWAEAARNTRTGARRLYVLLIGAFLIVVAGVLCHSLGKSPPATQAASEQDEAGPVVSTERLRNLPPDELYAKASPAVVRVVVRNRDFRVTGSGSGFVVTPDGLIVTNHHVVDDAYFAEVQFPSGSSYLVEGLMGLDSDADLALLKIDATNLPTLEMAEEVLPPIGTQVFAIGNPQGLTNTLSEGLVSGHRTTNVGLLKLQTTAAISPGSSGGPLLNFAGQVVGVTTEGLEGGQNLNFVVPVARVSRLLQQGGTIKTLASSNVGRLTKTEASTLEQVWRAVESANHRRALTLLVELRAEQGDSLYYWAAVGYVHLELGNNELAVEAYKTALQIAPHRPTIYFNLGLAYARSGRSEAAASAFRSAAALDPSNPEIPYVLGLELFTMERFTEAIDVLRLASQLASEKAKILTALGMAYLLADRHVEAVRSLESAVSHGARDAETYYWLGLSNKCLGRNSKALSWLQSALDADPNLASARCLVGEVYVRLKRYREAIALLEMALRKDPSSASAHLYLGLAYWETNQAEPSLEHFRRAAQLDPGGKTGRAARELLDPLQSLVRKGWTPREIREAGRYGESHPPAAPPVSPSRTRNPFYKPPEPPAASVAPAETDNYNFLQLQ